MSYAALDARQDSGLDAGARTQTKAGDPQKLISSSSTPAMMWWRQWPLTPGRSSATASEGGNC